MPSLNSAVYQINSWTNVSPELPSILNDFAKAAIRTDPRDLLQWSRDYFLALSRGWPPLAKDRWEDMTSQGNRSGITIGLLRLLHKQLSIRPAEEVTVDVVSQYWTTLGLERQRLDELLELAAMAASDDNPDANPSLVDWGKLVALAAGQLGDSLGKTMAALCQILSDDEDNGCSIPAEVFIEKYNYLANIDGDIGPEDIDAVLDYINKVAELQDGRVNQYNLKSPLCPNLH